MTDPTDTHSARTRLRTSLYVGLAVLGASAAAFLARTDAIPQSQAYHAFADGRSCVGIPNALDVFSNLAFLFAGMLGARTTLIRWATEETFVRWIWLTFFLGLIGVSIGSSYYHWSPDNERLMWDRLPMTIGFTGLFAAVVAERIHLKAARVVCPVLLCLGVISVLYWRWSETAGTGDLRPYILIQALPLVAIPLILWATPRRFDKDGQYLVAIGWYAVAKALEIGDIWVFEATGVVSGHTLKHLVAGLACYLLVRMYRDRRLLTS